VRSTKESLRLGCGLHARGSGCWPCWPRTPQVSADGSWLFKGRRLTCFSNEEETEATFAGNAPWLLEDRMRLAGAAYVAEPAWTPHAETDGNLVTGQQNYSAQVTADAVMKVLKG
jgi:putative intracellular protease/amidase